MQAMRWSNKVRIIGLKGLYTVPRKTKEVWVMYTMQYMFGHIQVYDYSGKFLFSADTEREAREELMHYEECAA